MAAKWQGISGCRRQFLAHHEIWWSRKNQSQSGYGGHGWASCRLAPVVNDPKRSIDRRHHFAGAELGRLPSGGGYVDANKQSRIHG